MKFKIRSSTEIIIVFGLPRFMASVCSTAQPPAHAETIV